MSLSWWPSRPWRSFRSSAGYRDVSGWGWTAVVPFLGYAILCFIALLVELWWVRSLHRQDPTLWFAAWFVYGYGLAFPILYTLALAVSRVRVGSIGGFLVWTGGLSWLLGGLTGYALFIEPAQLVERRFVIETERAPEEPLKILHVSDLQTDGSCRRERLAADAVRRGRPDLVIFTGDIANDLHRVEEREPRLRAAQAFFRVTSGRLGGFAVPGDWDGWVHDWPELLDRFLDGTNIRWLDNELVRLRSQKTPILVFGVGGTPSFSETRKPVDLRGEDGLRIVAAHSPDQIAELFGPETADLFLVGHTHGGQVVLPFLGALVTHTDLGIARGRTEIFGIPMLISAGLGMRGAGAPRVRLGCPPEISWVIVRRPGG